MQLLLRGLRKPSLEKMKALSKGIPDFFEILLRLQTKAVVLLKIKPKT